MAYHTEIDYLAPIKNTCQHNVFILVSFVYTLGRAMPSLSSKTEKNVPGDSPLSFFFQCSQRFVSNGCQSIKHQWQTSTWQEIGNNTRIALLMAMAFQMGYDSCDENDNNCSQTQRGFTGILLGFITDTVITEGVTAYRHSRLQQNKKGVKSLCDQLTNEIEEQVTLIAQSSQTIYAYDIKEIIGNVRLFMLYAGSPNDAKQGSLQCLLSTQNTLTLLLSYFEEIRHQLDNSDDRGSELKNLKTFWHQGNDTIKEHLYSQVLSTHQPANP